MSIVATAGTTSVAITLTWSKTTAPVTVYRVRVDNGDYVAVPNGEDLTLVQAQNWSGVDSGVPFGVPVYYYASSFTEQEVSTVVQVTSVSRECWLKHLGDPTLDLQISLTEIPALTYPSQSAEFAILGRSESIAVSSQRSAPQGTLTLRIETLAELQKLRNILADGSMLVLQTPTDYALGGSVYVSLGAATEQPTVGKVGQPHRRVSIPFTIVGGPSGAGTIVTNTWADVKTNYANWTQVNTPRAGLATPTWQQIKEGQELPPPGPGA